MSPVIRYFKKLLEIHKQVLIWPLNFLERNADDSVAIGVRNLKLKLAAKPHRFGYDPVNRLYFIDEDDVRHYFGNRARGFELYGGGLSSRLTKLSSSYLLEKLELTKTDTIIDCGANYADMCRLLCDKIDLTKYVSFEPGDEEYRAICMNAPDSNNNKLGLGNENTTRVFYLNSRSADSSVIEPTTYTETVEVQIVTLSSYMKENEIERVKLLKLEAEGFEPEILCGARDVLSRIEYVAIDGGYERGVLQEETLSEQTNILLNHGFEMIGINFKWGRALFRKKNLHV